MSLPIKPAIAWPLLGLLLLAAGLALWLALPSTDSHVLAIFRFDPSCALVPLASLLTNAGGFITRHYGRPRDRVHALQIEIARELYMDESRIERLERFVSVQHALSTLIAALVREAPSLIDG